MGDIINLKLLKTDSVLPCPFCGKRPSLHNTWTASYWLACSCGVKVHSSWSGHHEKREDHERSKRSAIRRWNRRVPTKDTP